MHSTIGFSPVISRRLMCGFVRIDFGSVVRVLVSLAFVTGVAASGVAARANTITVTSTADSATNGDGTGCTLRKAIINANNNAGTFSDCAAGSGADIINLPPGTITFTIPSAGFDDDNPATGDLDIFDSVTINGDAAGTTINAGGLSRIFDVDPCFGACSSPPAITVTINNLTITNGTVNDAGGGIRVNPNATVTMNGCTVSNCTVTANDGGGVQVSGTLAMNNCTVTGCHTLLLFGGIKNIGGTLTLTSCTITNNSALTLNRATGQGLGNQGMTIMRNTLIAGNNTQGGDPHALDVEGLFTTQGYNIIGVMQAGATPIPATGDQFGVTNAQVNLGPLANNGGPTPTHALISPSIAIDQGNSFGLTTDQRGMTRPCDIATIPNATGGDGSDVGAFELQGVCFVNHPPTARCKNITVPADANCQGVIMASDVDNGSSDPDSGDTITLSFNAMSVVSVQALTGTGPHTVTLYVTDSHGAQDSCVATVTVVDLTPPMITAPAGITAPNDPGMCSAALNPGTATATDNCPGVTVAGARSDGKPLNAPYPVGTTTIVWTATDASHNMSSAIQTIVVKDVEPPVIAGVSATPSQLWPPNHKMNLVTVNYAAIDNCGGPVTCTLSVSSNEPINGTGDGNTSPDWQVVDAHHVMLRAERSGNGVGRIYTITITCSDNKGNTSTNTVTVTVPHDQG
jgi:CSLREA domain-containing protein